MSRLFSVLVAGIALAACNVGSAAAAPVAPPGFRLTPFATAPNATTTGPDDIALLDGHIFVGWQNGVGPKGEPNPVTGQTASTVVEYNRRGNAVRSWSLTGKVDGMAGNPATHELVASVDEDGNTSLYTIRPAQRVSAQARHYTYSPEPDSATTGGVFTGGGTDAVDVYKGVIYLSASNPSAKNATAVFRVRVDRSALVAHLFATFRDNASATDAVSGAKVRLALTDPDSNATVPAVSPLFGGDFMLDSQGDQELVFAANFSGARLQRLSLTHGGTSAGVDDVRWIGGRGAGTLYIVDNKTGTVYQVRGPFTPGTALASLDTVGTAADNTEVDTIDLGTGAMIPFVTGLQVGKGLLWVP
jgi:hypothetical protein